MEDNQTCHQPQPVVETGSLILSVYYPDQEGLIVIHAICESDFSENDETVCSFDKKQSKNVVLNISQVNTHGFQIVINSKLCFELSCYP